MVNLKCHYRYHWEGISANGHRCCGTATGSSAKAVAQALREKNITPLNVKINSQFSLGLINNKITKKQIYEFTQQLATLIKAGISLQESLTIIAKSYSCVKFLKIITKIKASLNAGHSFTEALQQFPQQFDKTYCSLIKAGEDSGAFLATLTDLANYLQRAQNFKTKIRKAMVYPITVLFIATLVTLGLLLYVVPEFKAVFQGFGARLPALTRTIIALANALQQHGLLLATAMMLLIIGIRAVLKHTTIHKLWHATLLRTPIARRTIIILTVARWVRVLATTHTAGMPLIPALEAAHESIDNIAMKESMASLPKQVSGGKTLHQALQNTAHFPPQATAMIALGERSGTFDAMLSNVADIYLARANNLLDSLSKLLEPVIMLLLAVLMGGLIIAMYLPIFKLGSVL